MIEGIRNILPEKVVKCLEIFNFNDIYEIRMRRNAPIVVNVRGRNVKLRGQDSLIFVDNNLIDYVLKRATEYSIYAYNNQIRQGFITAKGGIRIGVAGESVSSDSFLPTTIKNIHSINIRIPHQVNDCARNIFKFIYTKEKGVKNTLIISAPGAGKTTYLRDISRLLSDNCNPIMNCLVVDERFEIASVVNGEPMLDVGYFTDIVSGSNKQYAFTNGIRSLRPDVILTDELVGVQDYEACKVAIRSGVKVIATIHSNDIVELRQKEEIKSLLGGAYFERYVVLSSENVGECVAVYDQNFECIYF